MLILGRIVEAIRADQMLVPQTISSGRLVWRKSRGCFREFGFRETVRRTVKEILRPVREPISGLDISIVTERLAIGAAPRSAESLRHLQNLGFSRIVDLRAERKKADILVTANGIGVSFVPTYDDWQPKAAKFFVELQDTLISILKNNHVKLLICCRAGEHRAPLAGVLALVSSGHSLEDALKIVQNVRPQAELLPVYVSSLKRFLESTRQVSKTGFVGSNGQVVDS